MARYLVYRIAGENVLLLDVQADALSGLDTRAVVPLIPIDDAARRITRLHPLFDIGGVRYLCATQLLTSVHARLLTTPVADLNAEHDCIIAALDVLLTGV